MGTCLGGFCRDQNANLYNNFDSANGAYINNWQYANFSFRCVEAPPATHRRPCNLGRHSPRACTGVVLGTGHGSNLAVWRRVKSFTWKYATDTGAFLEFNRNPSDYFVERIEDAYNKYRYNGLYEPFAVEGCPCTVSSGVFTCGPVVGARSCSQIGAEYLKGRLLFIDFKHMRAIDGGVARLCDPILCPTPSNSNGGRCGLGSEGYTCYTADEKAMMVLDIMGGCAATGQCFTSLPRYSDATGVAYAMVRQQTGISNTTQQNARIVPYNDRPTVGGGGASLRFDGVNDMAAATVGNFPKDAFTVMIWVKGTQVCRA